jgi:hypothetical protein
MPSIVGIEMTALQLISLRLKANQTTFAALGTDKTRALIIYSYHQYKEEDEYYDRWLPLARSSI